MTIKKHHEELVKSAFGQLKNIFEKSTQGIYLYIDDTHKVCNGRFAALLGYESADEWARIKGPFPELFVAEKSRSQLVSAYQNTLEQSAASTIKISWKKKSGATVDTTVIIVPMAYDRHLFALHFVSTG